MKRKSEAASITSPLVHFSKLMKKKLSFTNKDLVFHLNYYFGVYFRESIAVFIHTRVLLEVNKCFLFVGC